MTTIVCYDLMEEIGKYYQENKKKEMKEIRITKMKMEEVMNKIDLLKFLDEREDYQDSERYDWDTEPIKAMLQFKNNKDDMNFYFKGQEDGYNFLEDYEFCGGIDAIKMELVYDRNDEGKNVWMFIDADDEYVESDDY